MNGFYSLLRAHDLIWEDRTWPLDIRLQTCQVLWNLALKIAFEQGSGSASTADTLVDSVDKVLVRNAIVKQ